MNIKKCSVMVAEGSWHNRPCSRKAIIERDGKYYCKIHDPEHIRLKDKIANEKYERECCTKCEYHFNYDYYKYCPLCGIKRT